MRYSGYRCSGGVYQYSLRLEPDSVRFRSVYTVWPTDTFYIVAVCDDVVHVFSLIALYYNTGIDKNVIFITVATSPTM